MSIRVSAEELEKINRTSVHLPEGGGFMAWLEIFHELHCVVSNFSGDVDVIVEIKIRKFCDNGNTGIIIFRDE